MNEKYKTYIIDYDRALAKRREALPEGASRWRRLWLAFLGSGFARFFAVRWRAFRDAHPKGAELIAQFANFLLFSCSVTVWQYLVMLFLPYAFRSLAGVPFVWPEVTLWHWGDGSAAVFGLFNEPVLYDQLGNVKIGGGLGNFLAFEIAVFTAQCINFPLQRNITFRSKGNPWYQAMWYFLAWVVITFLVNSINCVWVAVAVHFVPSWLYNIGSTVLMGGVSMLVFFFVFKIIFPEGEASQEKRTVE